MTWTQVRFKSRFWCLQTWLDKSKVTSRLGLLHRGCLYATSSVKRLVSDGLRRHILGGSHRPPFHNGALTAVRYQDEILRANLRWCSGPWVLPGAVGPGFFLVQWALGSSWCRTMPGRMWPLTDPHVPQAWIRLRLSGTLCIGVSFAGKYLLHFNPLPVSL